jgi:hypothetical protein
MIPVTVRVRTTVVVRSESTDVEVETRLSGGLHINSLVLVAGARTINPPRFWEFMGTRMS